MRYTRGFLIAVVLFIHYQLIFAQSFKIGSVEVYGNRKVAASSVLSRFPIQKGDSINAAQFNRDSLAGLLKQISGVKHATVYPVCCDTASNLMLFIGIGENNAVILQHRRAPEKDITLPEALITAYSTFNAQLEPAIQSGQAAEDDSQGYALMAYPPAKAEEIKFIDFASRYYNKLVTVLHYSKYSGQRAAAAQIIAYAPGKKAVVVQLLYAVDDPDEEVRNNAVRALGILGNYGILHPKEKIVIPASPFIKMLNSMVWTDRNKGASVLMQLTQSRNLNLLRAIKQQALPSLIEMAKWEDRGHAVFSFFILGRIAGISEKELSEGYYAPNWPLLVKRMENKCRR